MVPINRSEHTSLVLVNAAQLMPSGLLGMVKKVVGVAILQPLMVNYWDLDLDSKVWLWLYKVNRECCVLLVKGRNVLLLFTLSGC